jgi:hypothetical protein
MKREIKRVVLKSQWCNWAIGVFLLFFLSLTFALEFQISWLKALTFCLGIILTLLLLETLSIRIYEVKENDF